MRILLLLAVLFWAAPAWSQAATTWNRACDGSGQIVRSVGTGGFACFYFEGLGAVDSAVIQCVAKIECIFRLDPDDSTTGAGTATVWIQNCPDPAQVNDFQCLRDHAAVLDGTLAAKEVIVKPGFYRVEIVGDGAATDDPIVTITGV